MEKRGHPPTPHAFPEHLTAKCPSAVSSGTKSKKIDVASCKVGMAGRKSYEAKKAEALHRNIGEMIARHGLERVVLCTLTFSNDPKSMKTAQKRFHAIAAKLLPSMFLEYITAVHRGTKRGRIHYHLIAVTKEDVRTGFDFEAWNRLLVHVHLFGRHNGEYRQHSKAVFQSANPALKAIWKTFRDRAEGYGFGMVETYPIRSNAEAIGRYVGSYVRVAAEQKQRRDYRMRTLRYSLGRKYLTDSNGTPQLKPNGEQDWVPMPRMRTNFSWLGGAAAAWRAGLKMLGILMGVDEFEPLFGKRWAWHLREKVTLLGRYEKRMNEKFYEVAEELAKLPMGERYAQVGEFCLQLAAFEKKEEANERLAES